MSAAVYNAAVILCFILPQNSSYLVLHVSVEHSEWERKDTDCKLVLSSVTGSELIPKLLVAYKHGGFLAFGSCCSIFQWNKNQNPVCLHRLSCSRTRPSLVSLNFCSP